MPEREFWDERVTEDEIRIAKYYDKDGKGTEKTIVVAVIILSPFIDLFPSDEWPQVLIEAKEHPILMSALGGLIWYLRSVSMKESVLMSYNMCD